VGAVPFGALASASSRDHAPPLTGPGRNEGGLRALDLLPVAERHAVGLSVALGLVLVSGAVALALIGSPVAAVVGLVAGLVVLARA
jgi:hypothetical protein